MTENQKLINNHINQLREEIASNESNNEIGQLADTIYESNNNTEKELLLEQFKKLIDPIETFHEIMPIYSSQGKYPNKCGKLIREKARILAEKIQPMQYSFEQLCEFGKELIGDEYTWSVIGQRAKEHIEKETNIEKLIKLQRIDGLPYDCAQYAATCINKKIEKLNLTVKDIDTLQRWYNDIGNIGVNSPRRIIKERLETLIKEEIAPLSLSEILNVAGGEKSYWPLAADVFKKEVSSRIQQENDMQLLAKCIKMHTFSTLMDHIAECVSKRIEDKIKHVTDIEEYIQRVTEILYCNGEDFCFRNCMKYILERIHINNLPDWFIDGLGNKKAPAYFREQFNEKVYELNKE